MSGLAAYQGAPGAFGEEACRAFLPDWRPLACASFAAVAETVAAGGAERGILPLRNAIAGQVPGNAELIDDCGLVILAERALPVRMHLLGVRGATLAELTEVVSHPMAIAQCGAFLAASGLASSPKSNTAVAARELAASGDRTRGVLASDLAASAYGLEILRRDVHDRADNHTVFAIVARRKASP